MARRPLDFRGFELVVYSACDSGIAGGRDADGMELEGLSALTRRQGAASVLGTLWKVSDGSVAKAMALFYGRIKPSKDSLADALRQTQLVMLRSDLATEPDHRHPFHWAPFVLIGSWR
jgi:CHAT domain-containing protein